MPVEDAQVEGEEDGDEREEPGVGPEQRGVLVEAADEGEGLQRMSTGGMEGWEGSKGVGFHRGVRGGRGGEGGRR